MPLAASTRKNRSSGRPASRVSRRSDLHGSGGDGGGGREPAGVFDDMNKSVPDGGPTTRCPSASSLHPRSFEDRVDDGTQPVPWRLGPGRDVARPNGLRRASARTRMAPEAKMKSPIVVSLGALFLATACAQPARGPDAVAAGPSCACHMGHGPGMHPMHAMGEPHHPMGAMKPMGPPGPAGPMGALAGPGPMDHPRLRERMRHARGREGAPVMRELARLGVHVYPPRMLLRRSAELGLSPEQVTKIRAEVLGAETRSADLRAKADKARIALVRLLAADKVDEHAVDAQIEQVASARADQRKVQVGVLLHVRSFLTPEQRKKLDAPRAPHVSRADAAESANAPMDDDTPDDSDDGDG